MNSKKKEVKNRIKYILDLLNEIQEDNNKILETIDEIRKDF
jgi:hypothetical protein